MRCRHLYLTHRFNISCSPSLSLISIPDLFAPFMPPSHRGLIRLFLCSIYIGSRILQNPLRRIQNMEHGISTHRPPGILNSIWILYTSAIEFPLLPHCLDVPHCRYFEEPFPVTLYWPEYGRLSSTTPPLAAIRILFIFFLYITLTLFL